MNIKVRGGQVVSGEITPSGSKNSAVAIIPSTILFDKPVTLENIPSIKDVERLVKIMEKLGSKIKWNKEAETMEIDNSGLKFEGLDKDDLGNMKGTALLWGPMLARFGKVSFKELPGGCTLGIRPLDAHYEAFKRLGVVVKEGANFAEMDASKAIARDIWLTEMSPTATENIVTLATTLKGITQITGAASEPQVQDLCRFLVSCGAQISGIGSDVLVVEGGRTLTPTAYRILSDHYEITTYLALAAATHGKIRIKNAIPELFPHINHVFSKFGVEVKYDGDTAVLDGSHRVDIQDTDCGDTVTVKAQPWPGLPVDTLPLFIPLALAAKSGQVLFHNWMYESGLFWTSELTKLGANIIICDPHRVIVSSGTKLKGATIEAPYIIRAVVSLVMSALLADGESTILNADALYRGHPKFVENLKKLGVKIEES